MTSKTFWAALRELGVAVDGEIVLPDHKRLTIYHKAGKLNVWAQNGDVLRVFDDFFLVSTYGHDQTKIGSEACFDIENVFAFTLAASDE